MIKKYATVLLMIVALAALYNNVSWFMRYLYPLKYEKSIVTYSNEYNVDPYLIAAVIRIESGFSPRAVSSKGAVGLMQIMPTTAKWAAEKMDIPNFTVDSLINPDVNIRIGTWYLSHLLNEFDGDATLALAAYNGGRSNVLEWIKSGQIQGNMVENIPFQETRGFVAKVKKAYKWYKRLYKLEGGISDGPRDLGHSNSSYTWNSEPQ